MDRESVEFKRMIKELSFYTKTQYEQHLQNQEEYKNLMQMFAHLNEEEARDLIHLMRNNKRLNFMKRFHGGV